MKARLTTLSSGLRVATCEISHAETSAIGIWAGVGGRHEPAGLNGISHFIEHMLFKGTSRRSARRIMEEIIETGAVTRGWFGVEVANITPELAESLGLAGTRGAIVGGIERGSPADRAGIRLGDVILAVGGREVVDLNATLNAIADVPPGKTVPVRILRRNQELALTVTVGRRKPRAAAEE